MIEIRKNQSLILFFLMSPMLLNMQIFSPCIKLTSPSPSTCFFILCIVFSSCNTIKAMFHLVVVGEAE